MKKLFLLISVALLGSLAGSASAQSPQAELILRPHCSPQTFSCPGFSLYDAETWITNGLDVGDTLEIDVVLSNPQGAPVQSIQSWLSYDPNLLQGIDVSIEDTFPLVAPGESAFDAGEGLVKIGASSVQGGKTDTEILFARVTFQVLSESQTVSRIEFHDFQLLGAEGHTRALLVEQGRTENILRTRPKTLQLHFGDDPPPSILPTPQPQPTPVPTPGPTPTPYPTPVPTPTPGPFPTPSPVPGSDGFSQLQPQNLRVMTEGTDVYVVWEPLLDPRVAGYSVYYGTVPGHYIQRRTLSADVNGVTISGLPEGKQYYLAVTAYSADQTETQYSFEVSVVVGDPTSSSAPFSLTQGPVGNVLEGSTIGSGAGSVPGETGLPLRAILLVLALASGIALLRFRHSKHS